MLGNTILKYFVANSNFDVFYTKRGNSHESNQVEFEFKAETVIWDLKKILGAEYDHVINCIGIIRPSKEMKDIHDSYLVNSYFPHILTQIADLYGSRVIHVSTDCVFSGKDWAYIDTAIPDETSVYGSSKFLWEVKNAPHITLRTSIIGREIWTTRNLIDWFLSNPEGSTVKWYTQVFWNWVTTLLLAQIIERIISKNLFIEWGLFQIASESISKYDILCYLNEIYERNLYIDKDDSMISNKTIISSEPILHYFSDLISKPIKNQIQELKEFEFR